MIHDHAVSLSFAAGTLWGAFVAGILSAIDTRRNRALVLAGLAVVGAGLALLLSWVLS